MADSLLDLGTTPIWIPDRFINWREDPGLDFGLARQVVEFPGTPQDIIQLSEETPKTWSFRVLVEDKQQEYELLEKFVTECKARTKRFWFPMPSVAFELAEFIPNASVKVTVSENNFEYRGFERFLIVLWNGDKITRKITAIERFPTTKTIDLTIAAMTQEIQIDDVEMFVFLALCRFDQDTIKLDCDTSYISDTTIKMQEVMEYSQV